MKLHTSRQYFKEEQQQRALIKLSRQNSFSELKSTVEIRKIEYEKSRKKLLKCLENSQKVKEERAKEIKNQFKGVIAKREEEMARLKKQKAQEMKEERERVKAETKALEKRYLDYLREEYEEDRKRRMQQSTLTQQQVEVAMQGEEYWRHKMAKIKELELQQEERVLQEFKEHHPELEDASEQ